MGLCSIGIATPTTMDGSTCALLDHDSSGVLVGIDVAYASLRYETSSGYVDCEPR